MPNTSSTNSGPSVVNAPGRAQENAHSHVKRVIGVVSGKGGVGKSLVSGLLACAGIRQGLSVGVLDADVTGPTIPRMFGVEGQRLTTDGDNLMPACATNGVKIVSTAFLLPEPDDPVIWRGPMVASAIRQFWSEVAWGDIDLMVVDMPPGTGDVALTVFQSLPVDGIVVVTSPQDLVSTIVGKAVKMAREMDVAVLGVVENMSHIVCPDCGRIIEPFGKSDVSEVAGRYGLDVIAHLPIDPSFAAFCDEGRVFDIEDQGIDADALISQSVSQRAMAAVMSGWSVEA